MTAYAYTTFTAAKPTEMELRVSSITSFKVWVNGKQVFARDEYHHGMEPDQYKFPVSLNAGKNEILIKVCQNARAQPWETMWRFQMRACDPIGTAILSTARPPRTVTLEGRDLDEEEAAAKKKAQPAPAKKADAPAKKD